MKYLMNPTTGSVDTEENWIAKIPSWETNRDETSPQDQFDSLVEVKKVNGGWEEDANDNGESKFWVDIDSGYENEIFAKLPPGKWAVICGNPAAEFGASPTWATNMGLAEAIAYYEEKGGEVSASWEIEKMVDGAWVCEPIHSPGQGLAELTMG